jgi:hypothetical protein
MEEHLPFSTVSLILIVSMLVIVIILIRFMEKKLEGFKLMLRNVGAIRIYLPFFNKQKSLFLQKKKP